MRIVSLLLSLSFLFIAFLGSGQSTPLDSIITANNLKALVGFIASDETEGRMTGSEGNKRVAEFLANEYARIGLKPVAGNDGYFMSFPVLLKGKTVNTSNVMAALPGKTRPEEVVIFSAHFDHIGTVGIGENLEVGKSRGEGTDSIYNGANDNASGTAAVITLARYFAALNNNARTILFIAFSGEELGLLGSYAFANTLPASSRIVAAINIEMIGRAGSPFITGGEYSSTRRILNRSLFEFNRQEWGRNFFKMDPFSDQELFERSDNYPLALKGIPAHTVMSTSADDRFYHSVKDELWTIEFNSMVRIVRGIALASGSIISESKTPSRISPSSFR